MKEDKISVIIPAYNVEKYIEKTVKSICAQTYRNLEIILVNDGSIDQTPNILDILAEKDLRIKVLHKENGGVTSARLLGVEVATGEWIGFVDGDDYIEPHMYEILLENAQKYNAEISHCGYQRIFPSRVDLYYGTGHLVEQNKKAGLKDLLEGKFIEPGLCNKLFDKKLFYNLLREKKMDLSIKNLEDLLMNYYLFSAAEKSVFIDKCLYHYVFRKDSASTAKMNKNKLTDPLKVLKKIESELQQETELRKIVKERIFSQLIYISTMNLKEQHDLIYPYRKEARNEIRKEWVEVMKSDLSIKKKIMVVWVAIWPDSYMWVHTIYTKVTGLDKKFEVV